LGGLFLCFQDILLCLEWWSKDLGGLYFKVSLSLELVLILSWFHFVVVVFVNMPHCKLIQHLDVPPFHLKCMFFYLYFLIFSTWCCNGRCNFSGL